jgi:photosystem II stability/assembly factor-like uncharacterized protein
VKRFLAGAALAVMTAASAARATVPDDRFQVLHWRSIGPFRGGRVLAVSGVPGEPSHFYFGAVNGGVWETVDAGRTWASISDAVPNGSVGALAVAPSQPRTLYLGTGEADMRSDIAQGIGAFRSDDGGKTWTSIGLKDSQAIGKILVDPRDPKVVLVAALGHPYGPNPERGVFRSEDGGQTWTKTLFKNADTGAIDLVYQPGNPDVVYASLWHTRRPPWNVYPAASGPGGGVYKSTDGGKTWMPLAGGLPKEPGRIGLAISQARPDRVFALVDAKAGGGLYRSDDAGETWAKVSDDRRIWERGWYFGGITLDPKNPNRVYVCDVSVYRSDDGGKTFVPVKGAPGGDDYHVLWIDPTDPARQMLGVDQGAVITLNGGTTWTSWYNQPTGQFYHVITDNRFPYWVYGAQQDSGAAGVPSRTGSLDGIDMRVFREVTAGGESDNIAPDPDDPDTVFGGRVDKLDLKTGQTKSVDPTLAFPDHYRGTWTLPLVFSKRDPHALYFGNQRVFRTTDGGQHWNPISPDLTREHPPVPANLDPSTTADENHVGPRRGVVYAIAPSPTTDGLIWAGTDDGLVWKTVDDGKHWAEVTPKGLKPWSKIGVIEASKFDPLTAYIAVDRHRLDDFAPYLYRTHDGGKTWTAITSGLTGDGPLNAANVVREDSKKAGLLYAGTERGAFVSFDDGSAWQPLGRDLPPTSVRDIDVHGDDVVIATHGRGFYVMDDVEPLRELAAAPVTATILFAPTVAFRARPFGFTGTPMPKDEPRAPNPPDGAAIDYYLATAPKGPVKIVIRDAQGAVVRRYASTDPAAPPDVSKLRLTPDWAEPAAPPSAGPGMQRFVWDLHYGQAPAGGGDDEDDDGLAKGVWAPPGRYTVELQVDGVTLHQTLDLKPDPRVKDTPQMYAAEFALAREVEVAQARAAAASADAQAVHDRLLAAAKTADRGRRGRLEAIDRKLVAVAGIAPKDPPPGFVASQSVTDLAYLSGALRGLGRAADGADGGPTPDAQTGAASAEASLSRTLADWTGVKAEAERELAAKPPSKKGA